MGKASSNLAFGAVTTCFLLVSVYSILLQQGINPLPYWKLQVSRWQGDHLGSNSSNSNRGLDYIAHQIESLVQGPKERKELEEKGIACIFGLIADACVTNKVVKIDTHTLTVYHTVPPTFLPHVNHTIRPYARKMDKVCMGSVSPVTLVPDVPVMPVCQINHNVPAVIFTTGGFTGNFFHDMNDIILPLFITSRHFQSQVKFVISDLKPWWVSKYRLILTHLSFYDIISFGKSGKVHCFPAAVVGLKFHSNLGINTTDAPNGYSILNFKSFLRLSFSLKNSQIPTTGSPKKPTLLLISRKRTRIFLNEEDMVTEAQELGFQVISVTPQQMWNLKKFAQVVNECSVLLGAHGAGLTNSLFLPAGAVLIQVVPLGLDWASNAYFGSPSQEMNINYMKYRVTPMESSLSDKYPPDHPVLIDPMSIHRQGYNVARAVYIEGQNMKLDLVRFRETLVEALQLLHLSPSNYTSGLD